MTSLNFVLTVEEVCFALGLFCLETINRKGSLKKDDDELNDDDVDVFVEVDVFVDVDGFGLVVVVGF